MPQTAPIAVGQLQINYLTEGQEGSAVGAFELSVPPQAQVPPPHSHTNNDEFVYVLAGRLRYRVDSVTRDLCAGESMYSPRGSVHHFSNPFSETARVLTVLTPDIGAGYFRDVAQVLNYSAAPDRARLLAVMSRYGLVPAPAPAAA